MSQTICKKSKNVEFRLIVSAYPCKSTLQGSVCNYRVVTLYHKKQILEDLRI